MVIIIIITTYCNFNYSFKLVTRDIRKTVLYLIRKDHVCLKPTFVTALASNVLLVPEGPWSKKYCVEFPSFSNSSGCPSGRFSIISTLTFGFLLLNHHCIHMLQVLTPSFHHSFVLPTLLHPALALYRFSLSTFIVVATAVVLPITLESNSSIKMRNILYLPFVTGILSKSISYIYTGNLDKDTLSVTTTYFDAFRISLLNYKLVKP